MLIVIRNQEEFDSLPEKFLEYTEIDIIEGEIIIKKNPVNSVIKLRNSSHAILFDSSSAILYNSSSAMLYNSSSAALHSSSSAQLYDSSCATLFNSSHATLFDSSFAMLYQDSSAMLYHSSRAECYGQSVCERSDDRSEQKVNLHENATLIDYDDVNADFFENAKFKKKELKNE